MPSVYLTIAGDGVEFHPFGLRNIYCPAIEENFENNIWNMQQPQKFVVLF